MNRVAANTVPVGAFTSMRGGRITGMALVLVSLVLYQSPSSREVFGRYSRPFAVWILLWTVGLAIALISEVRRRRSIANHTPAPRVAWADWAWMLWGTSFLISSVDDRNHPGRLLDGVAFGSTQPVAIVLDWLTVGALLIGLGRWLARRLSLRMREPALAVAAVAAVLWIGEGVARTKALVWPSTLGVPSYSGDLFARRFVHLNYSGYRDVDHVPAVPPGTHRLLLVGDSFAFGSGIRNPDGRFGEQLTRLLQQHTGQRWESINVSHGDRHTLDEIEMLDEGLAYRPSIVVLVYVFNDMDYLANKFSFRPDRPEVFEAPRGIVQRIAPARIAYWNSFLFQEVYARGQLLRARWQKAPLESDPFAPYRDTAAVRAHLIDLARFVSIAQTSGATPVIVPFDPTTATDVHSRERYARFVNSLRSANLPVWSLEGVFEGRNLADVTVNRLDIHPNGFANRLAVERVSGQTLTLASEILARR